MGRTHEPNWKNDGLLFPRFFDRFFDKLISCIQDHMHGIRLRDSFKHDFFDEGKNLAEKAGKMREKCAEK